MKVIEFTQDKGMVYFCHQIGDNSGEYVSLAEYQELHQLLERVDAIGPHLFDLCWFKEEIIEQSSELAPLLSDIKEALS